MLARPGQADRIVVLSGAGLSAASGVPTFRDANGLWEGHRFEDVATPEAWFRDPQTVRRFYDERRLACANVMPNDGHDALSRLQHWWGPERVVLVTQNIDGLLQKAGAPDVIEMHGSLWRIRCERYEDHPRVPIAGMQSEGRRCALCGGALRPDVVWFGEVPEHLDRIADAVGSCSLFLAVGTSGVVYPASGLAQVARAAGAKCVEINPAPSGGRFDVVIPEGSETALPRIVREWLGEE
jgi:NAD-dependent deacetylase